MKSFFSHSTHHPPAHILTTERFIFFILGRYILFKFSFLKVTCLIWSARHILCDPWGDSKTSKCFRLFIHSYNRCLGDGEDTATAGSCMHLAQTIPRLSHSKYDVLFVNTDLPGKTNYRINFTDSQRLPKGR